MSEYNLVDPSNELLSTVLDDFDFKNPPIDPVELHNIMNEKLIEYNGLGLSANQLGLPYRMFVLRTEEQNSIAVFNPHVTYYSDSRGVLEEGCLTYPNLFVKIRRPSAIRVRYQNERGEIVTDRYQGLSARCFLHELDHLDGVNYLSRANKYHLESAKKKSKIMKRKLKKLQQREAV